MQHRCHHVHVEKDQKLSWLEKMLSPAGHGREFVLGISNTALRVVLDSFTPVNLLSSDSGLDGR